MPYTSKEDPHILVANSYDSSSLASPKTDDTLERTFAFLEATPKEVCRINLTIQGNELLSLNLTPGVTLVFMHLNTPSAYY